MRYLRFLPLTLTVLLTLVSLMLLADIKVRDQSHLYDEFVEPVEETVAVVQIMVSDDAISQTIKISDDMPHFVSLQADEAYESSLGWNLAWQRAERGSVAVGFDAEMFTEDNEERPIWRALSIEHSTLNVDEPQMVIDSLSQMIDVPEPGHYTIEMIYDAEIDLPGDNEDQTIEGEIYRELIVLPAITAIDAPVKSPFPLSRPEAALIDWQAWDMHPCERTRDAAFVDLELLCDQYDPLDPGFAMEAAWLLLDGAENDMSSETGQLMAQISLIALLLDDFDTAFEFFMESAIAYGHAQDTGGAASSLHNLALVARAMDSNLLSDHYVRQAIHLRSTAPDETSAIFSACTLYVMWEQWDRALEADQHLALIRHPAAADLISLIESHQ